MASAMRLAVATKPIEPQFVSLGEVSGTADACAESIARRAFEIFQERGHTHGSDLEDWLRAEAELFHTAHLAVAETDEALAVSAEVPGFRAEELDVSVEPRRLTISGTRRTAPPIRRIIYCDRCSTQIFRALGLPMEVDPQKATAVLKDGILELTIPKAAFIPKKPVQTMTFSIVRAGDHRLWTDPFVEFLEGRL